MMKGTGYNQMVGPPQNILILHNPNPILHNPHPILHNPHPILHNPHPTLHNPQLTSEPSKVTTNPVLSPFIFTPLQSPISQEGQQRFILSVNNQQNNSASVLANVSSLDLNVLKLNLEAFKRPMQIPIQPSTAITTYANPSNQMTTSSLQFPNKTSPNKVTSMFKTSDSSQNIPISATAVSTNSTSSEPSKEKVFLGMCKVCGDVASGKYFGALVCVPCKTFFLRYAGEGFSFVCKGHQNCDISLSTRIQCKFCRFKKCIDAGMNRKVRPLQVEPKEGRQLCVVCSDIGNGVHFGAMTCEGCKKFFRRGLNEHKSYVCKYDKNCLINPQTRNACRFCRYNKCKRLGMSREAIQMGRPSKVLNQQQQQQRQLKRTEVMKFEMCPAALDLSTTSNIPVNAINDRTNSNDANNFSNSSSNNNNNNNDNNNDDDNNNYYTNNNYCNSNSNNNTNINNRNIEFEDNKYNDIKNNTYNNMNDTRSSFKNENDGGTDHLKSSNNSSGETQVKDDFEHKPAKVPASSSPPPPSSSPPGDSKMQESQSDSTVSSSTPTDPHMQNEECNRTFLTNSQILNTNHPDHTANKLLKHSDGISSKYQNNSSALEQFSRFLAEGYRQQKKMDEDDLKLEPEGHRKTPRQSCSSPSVTSSEDNCSTESNQAPVASSTQFLLHILEQKIMQSLQVSEKYWLAPFPHDENLMFSDARHWDIINHIFPNYDRFVQMSEKINRSLNTEYENWRTEKEKSQEMSIDLLSEWIKNKVIPAFTVVSVTYCKKVPGFSTFDTSDQIKIIKFGQSPSRMLAAVLHWFEPASKNFKHFLSWRDHVPGMNDRFKQSLIKFAVKMQDLQLDPIEAALLNSLIIVSTDYENLSNTKVIEALRCQIISTFRAYTTAKYGTPNDRLEKLFQNIPELRKLGLLHNEMTNTRTMMAEEFGDRLLLLLNL